MAAFWSRQRARLVAVAMMSVFAALAVQAGQVALDDSMRPDRSVASLTETPPPKRSDIVDRNNVLLASSLVGWSLFADPRAIWDAGDIVRELGRLFPDLDTDRLLRRLSDRDRAFVWIRRGLTPRQRRAVFDLGLEGLHFRRESRRVYPGGALAAHALGHVDIDGRGRAGVELAHDAALLTGTAPLRLTIDIAVQEALEDELRRAAARFDPVGAAGLVLDVGDGAVRAMASWPPVDPHHPGLGGDASLNRVSGGLFELGSVFKPLTVAAALDTGLLATDERIDVAQPVRVGSHVFDDRHRRADALQPWQIVAFSSNVGTARIAERVGGERLRRFHERLGLTARPALGLPDDAAPLLPERWSPLTTVTVGFGHGIAVSPLALASAYAAIANGGVLVPPRLVEEDKPMDGERVMRETTARDLASMLRAVVVRGTGRRADAPGYRLAGKTGTAEKPGPDGYAKDRNVCTFVGFFPVTDARYVILILIDEPRADASGGRTAGFNAAPVAGRLVSRIAPILGVPPVGDGGSVPPLAMVREGGGP